MAPVTNTVDAYVVLSLTGEYSDAETTPVAVYLDRNMAEEHARRGDARSAEIRGKYTLWGPKKEENEFSGRLGYWAAHESFEVEKVPLRTVLP